MALVPVVETAITSSSLFHLKAIIEAVGHTTYRHIHLVCKAVSHCTWVVI